MIKLLRLQHHRHSGRLLPHHHTSYRALFLLLAITGMALVTIQHDAQAADLTVFGKVPAPAPTTAAIITQPVDGTVTHDQSLIVEGSCEYLVPTSIVSVYDNGHFAGSTNCSANGSFAITIQLSIDTNILVVRTSSITDDYGPDSQPTSITYQPTTPQTTNPIINQDISDESASATSDPTKTSSNDDEVANPVSGYAIVTYADEQSDLPLTHLLFGSITPAKLYFSIAGGQKPYEVSVDWGDGDIQKLTLTDNDRHKLEHSYAEMHSYPVTITAIDSNNQKTELNLLAVTLYSGSGTIFGNTIPTIPFFESMPGVLVLCYATYILSLVLVGILWFDATIHGLGVAAIHAALPGLGTHTGVNNGTNGSKRRMKR